MTMLHCYTRPRDGNWGDKDPALGLSERKWATTMQHTVMMDEFITKYAAIMDKYDPAKCVKLAVDEWWA